MRAAAGLHAFRAESTFRTWFTGIALNCFRERRRRAARAGPAAEPAMAESRTQAEGPTLDVSEVLDWLSAPHREVLILHDVEGFTHEEIARALGIEIGTSKSRLSRARQLFRERWRAVPEPPMPAGESR